MPGNSVPATLHLVDALPQKDDGVDFEALLAATQAFRFF
jgi:hypothetical protein